MSELRQRRNTPSPSSDSRHDSSGGLTRTALLNASPQEHGPAYKLHVPLFFSILPTVVQKCINRVQLLKRLLAPRWEPRYLILLGSYLYKFVDNERMGKNGPKGSPQLLETLDIYLVDDNQMKNNSIDIEMLPSGCSAVFCVSTLRKQYYYAVSNREQASVWVKSIQEARQEAVKRSMNHAPTDSYPKSWKYFDQLGRSLRNQKERIRQRMEQKEMQELEMRQLGEGGGFSNGYFG